MKKHWLVVVALAMLIWLLVPVLVVAEEPAPTLTNTENFSGEDLGEPGPTLTVAYQLGLYKTAAESVVKVGQTIHYTITVKNEGTSPLTNVRVRDNKLGLDATIAILAVGSSQSYPLTYVVTDGDLPVVNNTANPRSNQTALISATCSVPVACLRIKKLAWENDQGIVVKVGAPFIIKSPLRTVVA